MRFLWFLRGRKLAVLLREVINLFFAPVKPAKDAPILKSVSDEEPIVEVDNKVSPGITEREGVETSMVEWKGVKTSIVKWEPVS